MKTLIQKWGITIYILVLSMHLYAQVLGEYYRTIQIITKLLLLPILILFLLAQDSNLSTPKGKWLIIFGLVGSFLGDAFLLGDNYFIPGMVAFMTTHIFNIIFFSKIYGPLQPRSKKLYLSKFILICFCFFIYFQLKSSMGALIYPVLLYMALICSAALMAIHVSNNSSTKLIANLFWTPGMLFFICSDTVLAFNKFSWEKTGPHIQHIGLVTMLTYGIAQLLLVKGFQLYFTTAPKEAV
jgi:uncharacterized membrane protein YhhN